MFQPDLFTMQEGAEPAEQAAPSGGDIPALLNRLTAVSKRPRYGFMVLSLIARTAGEAGSAGPYVQEGDREVPIRDWLSDALMPVAQRDARRRAMAEKVRADLQRRSALPADCLEAELMVEIEVRKRVRSSAVCNVSRVVSELVKAGLLQRHYQGYRVDHANRGAQRQAVYTITTDARRLLSIG